MIIICCRAISNIGKSIKRLKFAGLYSLIFDFLLLIENLASAFYFGKRGIDSMRNGEKKDDKIDGYIDIGLAILGLIIALVVLVQIFGIRGYNRALVELKRMKMNRGFDDGRSYDDLSVKDINEKESFEDF